MAEATEALEIFDIVEKFGVSFVPDNMIKFYSRRYLAFFLTHLAEWVLGQE